jgi:osmotically inducible lipoprotein OsmB
MQLFRMTLGAVACACAVSACASWTPAETGTAIGAATGGAIGHVITGGSVLGTVGGAAAGGVIGHEVGRQQEKK